MQLMTTEDHSDDRNHFTLNRKDLFEIEGESRLGGGVNGLMRGEKRNRGTLVSIEDCSWQSPFIQRKILYYGDGHPDLVEKILTPGNNSLQISPFFDNSSVYSATSMHSLYSAVETKSSKHQDTKVFPSFLPLLLLSLSPSLFFPLPPTLFLTLSLSFFLPNSFSLHLTLSPYSSFSPSPLHSPSPSLSPSPFAPFLSSSPSLSLSLSLSLFPTSLYFLYTVFFDYDFH